MALHFSNSQFILSDDDRRQAAPTGDRHCVCSTSLSIQTWAVCSFHTLVVDIFLAGKLFAKRYLRSYKIYIYSWTTGKSRKRWASFIRELSLCLLLIHAVNSSIILLSMNILYLYIYLLFLIILFNYLQDIAIKLIASTVYYKYKFNFNLIFLTYSHNRNNHPIWGFLHVNIEIKVYISFNW